MYLTFAVAFPLYFVNSLRLCYLSLSFLSFLRQFFNFLVFLNRSRSYCCHCCVFVFRCRSFSFLRRCCLIVFRSSNVFVNSLRLCLPSLLSLSFLRQFSNFFVFLSRSFSYFRHCCLLVFCSSTVFRQLSDFVCFLCRSL